jgi:hypothetical protein
VCGYRFLYQNGPLNITNDTPSCENDTGVYCEKTGIQEDIKESLSERTCESNCTIFLITHDFVRVFLVDTKTDNYKSGQWATFSASTTETSAYTLLQNLVKNIVANASEELLKNLESFPIMFKSLNGSVNAYEIPKITYNEFLKELKAACAAIGLNPALFATHSLRRGRPIRERCTRQSNQILGPVAIKCF